MKYNIRRHAAKANYICVAVLVAVTVFASSCDSHRSANLKTAADSAAYAIGILNGAGFRQSIQEVPGEPLNIAVLLAGFEASINNDSAHYRIQPEDAQNIIQSYFMNAQSNASEKALQEGNAFLEGNKAQPGVITTESGLQYQVIIEGTGAHPTLNDRVKVHYTGTLLDGSVFDSSVERGEPAVFGVSQVIQGWQEGLQIMPVGSKYIFWIPSELAYGPQGAGGSIKPNSTLKFEVELLEIVK